MAEYFVDDGGDNSDGLTWATAYTSINALDTAVALASGDIVNFGHDHNCQAVNAASLTITAATSGLPVIFRSVTTGSDPVTYQKGTGTQIDTTEGAFSVTISGSVALHGIYIKSGAGIITAQDANEALYAENCTLAPGANTSINLPSGATGMKVLINTIVDLSQESSAANQPVFSGSNTGRVVMHGLTFVNAQHRTAAVFAHTLSTDVSVFGADFSGFTSATVCEIVSAAGGFNRLSNCKTASTFTFLSSETRPSHFLAIGTNVGPTDDPTSLKYHTYFGDIVSSTSIYRSGGATIEGIANSWLVTTTANCNEYAPFHSPWLYSKASSTGSKTVSLYITNDTADFSDAECWIEVEYLATSGSPLWTLASDQRATITTTAVAQTDDTTSTWVGSGPAYTYKQNLSVAVTIGEVGQIRARVVTGVASIASSRNFYIDPDADKMVA